MVFLKTLSEQYSQFNSEKAPAYSNKIENTKKSIQSIDIKADILQYLSENKTGVSVPKDIEYVAYDAANPIQPGLDKPAPPPTNKSAKPVGKIGKYQGPAASKDPTAKVKKKKPN